jgi:hypothetical protein
MECWNTGIMNTKTVIVMIGAAAVIALALYVTTPDQKTTPPAPEIFHNPSSAADKEVTRQSFLKTIGSLKLAQLIEGNEAQKQISRLHGQSISMASGFIAAYQGSGDDKMTIWVSVHKDSKEAESLIAKMHEKIDTVAKFQNHQDLDISDNIYHFVTGMGQSHYFYYRGNDAVWIGLASPEEMKILSEVIHML